MITGVSFKRKLRDLVLRKDENVWKAVADQLDIQKKGDDWISDGCEFDILESREHKRGDIEKLLKSDFEQFKKRFWDARVFGNTFLEDVELWRAA